MFSRPDAYERFMARWSALLAPQLVALADVRDGDTVLDVGCGTGALTRAVAAVNRTGRLTGIDPADDYVRDAARQTAEPRITFQAGDARQLPFPDASFDRALSALVLNFIPEPARALHEMVRVTRPGGVIAAAVWDYADGMTMLRAYWDEAVALDPAVAARDEAHMPLCREGELAALWRDAQLANVREAPLTVTLRFASFDDYWAPFLLGQGPAGAHAVGLPADQRGALEQRLRDRLLGGAPDGPIEMPARAWAVTGTRPA